MNNHWGTNYRAYQEGPTWFRFVLRPHRRLDRADAARFATGFSQPLLPVSADAGAPANVPLLRVEPADVLVSALKPSDDGKAWIVRLFGASGKSRHARILWNGAAPKSVTLSDTSEQPGSPVHGTVTVPGYGLVTLRAEHE
jgi:alpha-mannosidase